MRWGFAAAALTLAGCLPYQVDVVQIPSQAVLDLGAGPVNVDYNQDHLSVTRAVTALTASAEDQAGARQAIRDYCGGQGLGFVETTSTFDAATAAWRFKGNCLYPNGVPVTSG